MTGLLQKHHRTLFYLFWICSSLVQASFTELLDDEAYYWVFSRFLDWGYFDHPPMIAVLIKIGYSIFQSELGVRLLIVLLSTLTIYNCELLFEKKNPFLFYAICFSLAVLQLGSILAVPDIPLMFFTSLFFLCYRRFIKNYSPLNTILLAMVTALMMYSKYHAVLIVLFTLLSNLKLLQKGQTYVAGLLVFLLFVPHLWWQYNHDWISFRYHLFESNVNPYKISYTTEYLLGQLLITGPITGFIFLIALFRYKPKTATERALQFTGVGLFLFFLLSSFRGRVEANWTAPAIVPILILSHQYLQASSLRRWVYKLLPLTIILVIVARVIMIADLVPATAIKERFHLYQEWPKELSKRTKGLPVVFNSSYQKASKYWFYSGQVAYSLNEYKMRRNNFNYWPIEDQIFNRPVYLIDHIKSIAAEDSMQTPLGNIHYAYDSNFHSFTKLMFVPEKKEYLIKQNEAFTLAARLSLPYKYGQYLSENRYAYDSVKLGVYNKQKWIKDIKLHLSLQQLIPDFKLKLQLNPQLRKGTYFLRFAVRSDAGFFTHNSDKIKLEVE